MVVCWKIKRLPFLGSSLLLDLPFRTLSHNHLSALFDDFWLLTFCNTETEKRFKFSCTLTTHCRCTRQRRFHLVFSFLFLSFSIFSSNLVIVFLSEKDVFRWPKSKDNYLILAFFCRSQCVFWVLSDSGRWPAQSSPHFWCYFWKRTLFNTSLKKTKTIIILDCVHIPLPKCRWINRLCRRINSLFPKYNHKYCEIYRRPSNRSSGFLKWNAFD